MGFRAIFWKSLLDLSGWKSLLIMAGLVTLVSTGVGYLLWHPSKYWPEGVLNDYALHQFLIVSFFWTSGFFLAFLVASKAASSIARESSEGTLLILVSKPVHRRAIVLGKLAALFVRAFVLTAVLLFLSAVMWRLALGLSEDALAALLKAVPWLLLYSAVLILFFGSIATALSAIIRNVVVIMVIMACLIMFVFLLGPFVHFFVSESSDVYTDYHLYLPDLSYHAFNASVPFLEQASGGMVLSPHVQSWPGYPYVLSHHVQEWEPTTLYHPALPLNYLRPFGSLLMLLVISLAAIRLSMAAIARRDVH